MTSKGPPRTPKDLKDLPGTPQGSPRTSQRHLKDPKDLPRPPKDLPRTPKVLPESPQGPPKDPKDL